MLGFEVTANNVSWQKTGEGRKLLPTTGMDTSEYLEGTVVKRLATVDNTTLNKLFALAEKAEKEGSSIVLRLKTDLISSEGYNDLNPLAGETFTTHKFDLTTSEGRKAFETHFSDDGNNVRNAVLKALTVGLEKSGIPKGEKGKLSISLTVDH